ncbi:MAG: AfsR/SARP family transcriptional regulator, partial [Acidimicrobiia bacterium]
MEFLLLGPLEVIDDDGRSIDLGRPQQRALLAVLLLSLNRVVPLAEIIEGLWGERPPATAANVVQGCVSRLRKALGHGARIETVAAGYRLEAETETLDLVRFEQGAAEG